MLNSSDQLKSWNQQGLIPGPDENEQDYVKRVHFCLHLGEELAKEADQPFPYAAPDPHSQSILANAAQITAPLFDIHPNWVPLFFHNYQLLPWHGGCAWIFQLNDRTPTAAFLQLRKAFKNHTRYFGLYKRQELISHELAHVGRMMYQEPQFEEILAYQTSPSRWRRWLGPIVQSSKESMFIVLLLGIMILTDLASITLYSASTFSLSFWLKILLAFFVTVGIGRLIWRYWLFNRCLHHLSQLYDNPQQAHYLLYRLRDHEIRSFAFATPRKIREFIQSQLSSSFRWHFLMVNYPFSKNS